MDVGMVRIGKWGGESIKHGPWSMDPLRVGIGRKQLTKLGRWGCFVSGATILIFPRGLRPFATRVHGSLVTASLPKQKHSRAKSRQLLRLGR